MRAPRILPLLLLSAAMATLGACGGASDEDEVRAAVDRFAQATQKKDYQRLCDEILAPELIRKLRSVGLPCEIALKTGLDSVRAPRVEVGAVTVGKKTATAQVRTTAANQDASRDTIRLVHEGGDWKVASLSGG